ncbi:D-sedoheptulose-7-phosphate isomerase [Streptomyces ipomoeae]|nr:SIS domain-containing protein [Streptomyces ipomoeae]MDX2692873.1 SIS domain-containing protein [Streptomyces ipomoeae]MDX2841973.1 SIS domain-containing protein [Streptomyces ipomoeae]
MKLATDVAHCDDLMKALEGFRWHAARVVDRWGITLADRLGAGARLLVAGNGGSAAQAQHLTAELVGRYRDDRPPFSALALHADTSSTTAIANDYGVQEIFARQVAAHGRAGDLLMLLSTSGASANLLVAAQEAHRVGMTVRALTGPAPNPLQGVADEALCVEAASAATVQELHLVAVHMLCESFDRALERRRLPGDGRWAAMLGEGDGYGKGGRFGEDGAFGEDGGLGKDRGLGDDSGLEKKDRGLGDNDGLEKKDRGLGDNDGLEKKDRGLGDDDGLGRKDRGLGDDDGLGRKDRELGEDGR